MKRSVLLCSLIFNFSFFIFNSVFAQCPSASVPTGAGTGGNPYIIATFENLKWISENSSSWSATFSQTADIDASITSNACYNAGAGWSPIGITGTPFTGTYDGNGHTISGLFINRPTTGFVGLFGRTSTNASFTALGLTDIDIVGDDHVGGLVGQTINSTVTFSYSTGTVSGVSFVGGLLGHTNNTTVTSSYSTADVSGSEGGCGGLVGYFINESITSSYATGAVSGGITAGGLVGSAYDADIIACYSTGAVSGSDEVGGLIGNAPGGSIITNSFWDTETSGQATSAGITEIGKTTAEMKTLGTFTAAGWDFQCETANGTDDTWGINAADNNGYPFLSWQPFAHLAFPSSIAPLGTGTGGDPYLITTFENLMWISENEASWGDEFLQTADIDASITSNACYNGGEGWIPLGNMESTDFAGVYDGNGHTISGLFIDRDHEDGHQGFFGNVGYATITSLGLIDVNINGDNYRVGGLIATSFETTISDCYVTGSVTGREHVGGLVGGTEATYITSCYSIASVTGDSNIGGFVGENGDDGSITTSYAAGPVNGNSSVGGFIGNYLGSTISDCFWDTQASGQAISDGGTGKTTAQMTDITTFTDAGWDFQGENTNGTDDVWGISCNNGGYPFLSWQPFIHDGNCHVWTGATSTAWNNATNWSRGNVPTVTDNITITSVPANQPIVNGALAECGDVVLNEGATLTIAVANALTVHGNLSNSGTVLLQADGSGMASLITLGTISGAGSFQMEQYLLGVGDDEPAGVFQYVSSPISNATSAVYDAAGTDKLWIADEATQNYSEITNNSTSLNVGEGYVARVGASGVFTFDGTAFNTGNVTITGLTRTGTEANNRGYNLIGNPYPSSVDWNEVDTTNLYGTIWYRTHDLGNNMMVSTYNAANGQSVGISHTNVPSTGIIPPGQAFWVRVKNDDSNATLSFTNAMRLHGTQSGIYKLAAEEGTVRMLLSNGTTSDETLIIFSTDADDSFEHYDSHKMWTTNAPQLYTTVASDTVVMNSLYSTATNPTVDLGLKLPTQGNYTLNANSITIVGETVHLEDRLLNIFQDLNEAPSYAFTSEAGNIGNRFALHFGMSVTGVSEAALNSRVYASNGNQLNIILSENATSGRVEVLDMAGRIVHTSVINSSRTSIGMNVNAGVYLVRVASEKATDTHRVILN